MLGLRRKPRLLDSEDHRGKYPACHRSAAAFTRVIDAHTGHQDGTQINSDRAGRTAEALPQAQKLTAPLGVHFGCAGHVLLELFDSDGRRCVSVPAR